MRKKNFLVLCSLLLVFLLIVLNVKTIHGEEPSKGKEIANNIGFASINGGTTGGSTASKQQTFIVHNRQDLLKALGSAENSTPKIIYISGSIDMNKDENGNELTEKDYVVGKYSLQDYLKAYNPEIWGKEKLPTGDLENWREESQKRQAKQISIDIPSNTTIYGINNAKLIGVDLNIFNHENIIIRNIAFTSPYDFFPQWDPTDGDSGNWNSQYDSITIKNSHNIWIDHNSFSDGDKTDKQTPNYFGRIYQHHDGCVDITNGSDDVTFSHNRVSNHDKTMLIGSSDSKVSDRNKLHVTICNNWFSDLVQRQPRVRFGKVHIFNNYYSGNSQADYQTKYLIGVGKESTILAQNNVIEIPYLEKKHIVKVFNGTNVTLENTLFNGTTYPQNDDLTDLKPVNWQPDYSVHLNSVNEVKDLVTKDSGPNISDGNSSITPTPTPDPVPNPVWNIANFQTIGYINYVPGYGIAVYNAPAGRQTGNYLLHGTAWRISQKATNDNNETYYRVGKNQWIKANYISFTPIEIIHPLHGVITINYISGYGVNLWKNPNFTDGYYAGRKLMHSSKWKTFGKENGFYKIGKDQWVQGKYVIFQAN